MKQWKEYSRGLALDEMLRLEGWRAHIGTPCGNCSTPHPLYQCTDCFGHELFCQPCILATHRHALFHTIEVSNLFTSTACSTKILYLFSIGINLSSSRFL
jgi:hypothetical protein